MYDIIGTSESWLDTKDRDLAEYAVPGYTLSNSDGRKHGRRRCLAVTDVNFNPLLRNVLAIDNIDYIFFVEIKDEVCKETV